MTGRFIAASLLEPSGSEIGKRLADLACQLGLTLIYRDDHLIVYAEAGVESNVLPDAGGVAIGHIYCRHVPSRAFDGHPERAAQIASALRSGELSREYWGSYLILTSLPEGGITCTRSPFCSINCYYLVANGSIVVATDAALMLEVAERPRSINWDSIARHLIWDNLSMASTCLSGIFEVRCGESIRFDARQKLEAHFDWDPWTFTESEASIADPDEAVELVRREILRCIGAQMPRGQLYGLDLSGGLDSSIIATAAVFAGREIHAITMFSEGNDGDERHFARSVARHLGIFLDEGAPDYRRPNLLHAARAHLPRPHSRSFVQETDRISQAAAEARSIRAFVNGQGGDAVFCHLQSSGPAADAFLAGGPKPSFARTVVEVARANRCNAWDIAWKAMKKAFRGKEHRDWYANEAYLAKEIRSSRFPPELPWPSPQARPLPGKVEHVHGLYNSCYNMNGYSRSDLMAGIFPLLSQPLVETCLRIPTWLWVGSGRGRLIARRAMAHDLPKNIGWRISKGGLGQLQLQMLRERRLLVREILMDGLLSGAGILDRNLIEQRLNDDLSFETNDIGRILRLCDFEAWCRASPKLVMDR